MEKGYLILDRNILLYVGVLSIFGLGIYLVLASGTRLESGKYVSRQAGVPPTTAIVSSQQTRSASNVLSENLREPLSILLLQVMVILVVARVVGSLFHRFGQPPVIGEMIAGILLGPSLLGMASPKIMSFLFPA